MELKAQLISRSREDRFQPGDSELKRVPAVDKCFAILDLIAGSGKPLGVSEMSRRLCLNKSTVFYIVRTLADLEILEYRPDGKLAVGTRLYVLGKTAGSKTDLVRTVHPYLRAICRESRIASFLVVRSGMDAVIVDKSAASAYVHVSYEIGSRLPLVVGAAGIALLCRLSHGELDSILQEKGALDLVCSVYRDEARFREEILKVRATGIAVDIEEHVKGVIGLAVPINTHREDLQAAVLAVGLERQLRDGRVLSVSKQIMDISAKLDRRFSSL
ncbi:MAG: IclR family transcriptional regulator [Pseudomonadota bacterium]